MSGSYRPNRNRHRSANLDRNMTQRPTSGRPMQRFLYIALQRKERPRHWENIGTVLLVKRPIL
ncbi:hypothetical protein BDW22DRAFT_1364434 [Trametopsis cervina]|nr:hypothetical protein BDW22DRAFT_1364434 [Trametopsis cervina]